MDRETWHSVIHRVAESDMIERLNCIELIFSWQTFRMCFLYLWDSEISLSSITNPTWHLGEFA